MQPWELVTELGLPKISVILMFDVGAVWQDHTQDFPFIKQLAASLVEVGNLVF